MIRDLAAKGNKKILINLTDVSYIDSSGIGEMVSSFTTVTNHGGQLKLLGLTKRVKDLLQITKLYTVFEVFEDEASADSQLRLTACSRIATVSRAGCPRTVEHPARRQRSAS